MTAEPTEAMDRPTFTVSAAAEATGKSRRTIARLLDADSLPGATRDESGAWCIPLEALLAAGLRVHAPSPPDEPQEHTPTPSTPAPAAEPTEAEQLRAELADWRRRAEVAEAVAAERAAALADVRSALELAQRMLPVTTTPETTATPAVPATSALAAQRPRWWRRERP